MIADSLSSSSEDSTPPSPRAGTSKEKVNPFSALLAKSKLSKKDLKLKFGILPSVTRSSLDKQPSPQSPLKSQTELPANVPSTAPISPTPRNSLPNISKETPKSAPSTPEQSSPKQKTNPSPDLLKEASKSAPSSPQSARTPPLSPTRGSSPDLLKKASSSQSSRPPAPPPRRGNKQSLMLSKQENKDVFRLLGTKCQSLATAKVELFVSNDPEENNWESQEHGVACFVKDAQHRSYYIRVFSLEKKAMLWEIEIKPALNYQSLGPCFHVFHVGDCHRGLNFTDDAEANNFKRFIEGKLKQSKGRRQGDKEGESAILPTNSNESTSTTNNENKKQMNREDTEDPNSSQLITYLGFPIQDESEFLKFLESNVLDPKVEQFLSEYGVTKEDLKEKETREYISSIISKHSKTEDALKEDTSSDVEMPKTPPSDIICKTRTTTNIQMATDSVCLTNSAGNIKRTNNISQTKPQKPHKPNIAAVENRSQTKPQKPEKPVIPQKPQRKFLPSDQTEIPHTVHQPTTQSPTVTLRSSPEESKQSSKPTKPTPLPREYKRAPSTKTLQQAPTEANQSPTNKWQQSAEEMKQPAATMETRPVPGDTEQSVTMTAPETTSEETEQYTSTVTQRPELTETNQSTPEETIERTPKENNQSTLTMTPQTTPRDTNQSTPTKPLKSAPRNTNQSILRVIPHHASGKTNQGTLIKELQSALKNTNQFTPTKTTQSVTRENNPSAPTKTPQPVPRKPIHPIPTVKPQPVPRKFIHSIPTVTPQPTPKETIESTPTKPRQPAPRETNQSVPAVTQQPIPKETIQSTLKKTPPPIPRKPNQSKLGPPTLPRPTLRTISKPGHELQQTGPASSTVSEEEEIII